MSDCMTFPDSVEKFMEEYKVVDTDCVYSNGIEFVPIFRMKQWFEHLQDAELEETCDTCKYGYFGNGMCDYCRMRYPSNYERRTDET